MCRASSARRRDSSDRIFRGSARSVGASSSSSPAAIGLFLGYQMVPTLHHYGLHFFTENQWDPEHNVLGISAVLLGTFEVAVIALMISFPLALLTALYISEYAPSRLRGFLVALVDLMAAVPSIVYGLWGLLLIMPHALLRRALPQRVLRLVAVLPGRHPGPARRPRRSSSTTSSRRHSSPASSSR